MAVGASDGGLAPRSRIFDPEFVVRASTAVPQHRR
ncbi:hypothetical protein ACVWWH_003543 [Sinomonas sp. RB5]